MRLIFIQYVIGFTVCEYFIKEPNDSISNQGSTVVLECILEPEKNSDNFLVQWAKGTLALGFPPQRSRFSQSNGPKNYSLIIEDVQPADDDNYTCQITSKGIQSKVAKLVTLVPPRKTQIIEKSNNLDGFLMENMGYIDVIEGEMKTIQCISYQSKPATQIDWQYEESLSIISQPFEIVGIEKTAGSLLVNTTTELQFLPKRKDNGKRIECLTNHPALETHLLFSLTINVLSIPFATLIIDNNKLIEGASLAAVCHVENAKPTVSEFIWKLDFEILEEQSAYLSIDDLPRDYNGRTLSCTAINAAGNDTEEITMNVLFSPKIESIEDLIVDPSENIILECGTFGNPLPQVEWFHNSILVSNSALLKLDAVETENAGEYTCEAESEMGVDISKVTIYVRGPPMITSKKEQSGQFSCDFMSEPAPEAVQIMDISTSTIVFATYMLESQDLPNYSVESELSPSLYECQVTNKFGTTKSLIRVTPNGLPSSAKIGIVAAVLFVALILMAAAFIKLHFFRLPATRKFSENGHSSGCVGELSGKVASNRDDNFQQLTETKPIIISRPFLLIEENGEKTLPEHSIKSLSNVSKNLNLKGMENQIETQNASSVTTNRSRNTQDDGYSTVSSGSDKKDTSSIPASHPISLDSGLESADLSKSKLTVIWDDTTIQHDYLPQSNLPQSNIFFMSKQRSVTHV